ncbi:hypothetical protein [Sneathiella sp.]|uniref:hypothetical protein n=1 Tax=Sneathiella sp. TaxID=1964365 RepID=UPI003565D7CB
MQATLVKKVPFNDIGALETVAALIGYGIDFRKVPGMLLGRTIHEGPVLHCSSAKHAMNEN